MNVRHIPGYLALAAALVTVPPTARAAAPAWTADAAQSTLSFVGTQQGEKFTGVIKRYKPSIRYSATDLATSSLDVSIDLTSIDTKSPDRDQALATDAWFDYKRYATATFRSVGALKASAGGATADADLTIRGKTKRIAFPFRFTVTGNTATLDAKVTLDRLDYGLGAGEWADDSVIGHKVDVIVHLVLHPGAN